jgi:uncharacterized protein with gpF-like domain
VISLSLDALFDKPVRRHRNICAPKDKELLLRPVRPNIGIEVEYKRRLHNLIDQMHKSVLYWLKATYRRAPPKMVITAQRERGNSMAHDELAATALKNAIKRLAARWLKNFDTCAVELAEYFSKAACERSDANLKAILKKGGIAIDWTMTAAQRDVLRATIEQQVGLIKSIPREHLARVQTLVMQSVQTGRDLEQLAGDLERQFNVTKRRAAFIARDQSNKATASLTRARQIEIGVTEAIWMHSGGGKHPRPKHVKAGRDKQRYDVTKGLPIGDRGEYVFPGECINCRCVSRAVVKGFN